ncbi:MAG: FAD-dependent oxidoreductase [Eubacteriales bacterium]
MAYITEPEKKLPISGEYEVVVAGGGIAGMAAALAAARAGAKTLLVEREYTLGGLATLGLVTIYLPLDDGMGRQVSFGIVEELLHLSISHGWEGRYPEFWLRESTREERKEGRRFEVQFSANLFALLGERLLAEAGVQILYGTAVAQTAVRDGRITHVIVENKSGRSAIACRAAVDTTGDALLCRFAGAPTATYRFGNTLAAWYYFLQDGENRLQMVGYAEDPTVPQGVTPGEAHYTGLDAAEVSEMTLASHAATLRHFLNKVDGKIEAGKALTALAGIPQLRMTRRIEGAYTLDVTEAHTPFPDSVGMFSNWRKAGPVYEVPYRTLWSPAVKNLITAGRTISVSELLWDLSRAIPACAVTGQAAGLAAALSDDFSTLDIGMLQAALRQNGVVLHESELEA